MIVEERIEVFSILGSKIKNISKEDIREYSYRTRVENQWFTEENIQRAFDGLAFVLEKSKLEKWVSNYDVKAEVPKIVGIVMAGNIPLVGFHDLMCVLIGGHFAVIKVSNQDAFLTNLIISWLLEIEPRFKRNLEVRDRLTGIEAVIATGSDNTARYFEYYFKDIPSIIRKNRTSIAILNGRESIKDLKELGKDIFWYFGLGCRNVSKLLVPKGYDPTPLFEANEHFSYLGDHNKYKNNYDYYKSIFLVNGTKHLDNGFLLWLPTTDLVSPISVLYAQEYSTEQEASNYLDDHQQKIQCVVGKDHILFGSAQLPEPWNYADNVDTMEFLAKL